MHAKNGNYHLDGKDNHRKGLEEDGKEKPNKTIPTRQKKWMIGHVLREEMCLLGEVLAEKMEGKA